MSAVCSSLLRLESPVNILGSQPYFPAWTVELLSYLYHYDEYGFFSWETLPPFVCFLSSRSLKDTCCYMACIDVSAGLQVQGLFQH